ncbi:MAG: CPXCG motif-containing cysteine-rich protein [Chthoniobacterales bacterium]
MNALVETEIACPHCGESFPLLVDTTQREQALVEDCSVCCRPINLTIVCAPGEVLDVLEED